MPTVETQIEIHLPDGSTKSVSHGSTAFDLAAGIADGLKRRAVGALINGALKDVHTPLSDKDKVKILTADDPESIELLRHSTAHVMAEAVQRIFPEAKIAIGPTIEDGFYYDFDIPGHSLEPDDLERIEKEMRAIATENQRIVRHQIPDPNKQVQDFKAAGERFKAELLEEHKHESPTLYLMQDKDGKTVWNDLCRGPHLPNTGLIKAFKLLKVSGSYWRGDEHKDRLQRIYATSFWKQSDLEDYLKRLEEAEKRDHRKLSKQLDLFSVHDAVGPGLIFWHPNLAAVRAVIEDFWRIEHRRHGYQFVYTPHIANEELYRISGHLQSYGENMYSPMDVDDQPYRVKPMNCPGHIMIYKSGLHSYRDLPLRFAELGTVYRYERSGVLHGMLRVRGFTQDDSHIFCTPEQLQDEINGVLDLTNMMMDAFGYTYKAYLSTMPKDHIGTPEEWEIATAALRKALEARNMEYEVDEGGGAFYAPKIDYKLYDAIGREWQGTTVQVDLNLPKRFDVTYIDEKGERKLAVMVHRAILGSLERFIGGLIEHYSGAFPTWLAPIQVRVLPISDKHREFAKQIQHALEAEDMRVQLDDRSETINYRVREAQMQQVPYMLIVGDREMSENKVAVRHRRDGDLGSMSTSEFVSKIKNEIRTRN
jgi:threonyl-tRNA synthetase